MSRSRFCCCYCSGTFLSLPQNQLGNKYLTYNWLSEGRFDSPGQFFSSSLRNRDPEMVKKHTDFANLNWKHSGSISNGNPEPWSLVHLRTSPQGTRIAGMEELIWCFPPKQEEPEPHRGYRGVPLRTGCLGAKHAFCVTAWVFGTMWDWVQGSCRPPDTAEWQAHGFWTTSQVAHEILPDLPFQLPDLQQSVPDWSKDTA